MQPSPSASPAQPGATPGLLASHSNPGASQLAGARSRLALTADLPLAERVTAFDEIHRLLQDALAAVQQVVQAAPPVSPQGG